MVLWENIAIGGYQNECAVERDKRESKDYYILFRDTEVPELTDSDYEKRCAQEDLLPADKATYVWGHIDMLLPSLHAGMVQTRLDKQLEDEFKEKTVLSNASVPCQFGYELAVYYPLASILKKLSKVSPNLAFLFNVPRLPLQRFWYFPESDDESWQIRQILESQQEQEGSGIFWHLHRITIPKKTHSHRSQARHTHRSKTRQTRALTQSHRSFVQVLSLDAVVEGLKRVGYCTKMDLPRRAAAVWVIEASLAHEKLIHPGFTRGLPFTTPPILPGPPSDARADFKSAIADEKYLPTLSDRQLEILERGVTVANNIMTSFRPAYKKIANKYEAMRLNNEAKKVADEKKRIEEEKKRINDEEKKNVEKEKRVNEEAKRVSDKIYSPFPHLMEAAASGWNTSDIIIDGNTTEIGDTTGNPLHVKDVAVVAAIKEQVEATREQTELLKKLTARDRPLKADTRTVEYSEKALEQRGAEIKPLIAAIDELPGKIGSELQDAWAKFNDPPDETELDYARRLRRTTKNTYDQIAALVEERFPDGKYQAGDGENIRKALNPPKKKE